MTKKEFVEKNRKKVLKRMMNDSVLVLFNGRAPYKRGDERYPFSPDRNFYYVAGLDRENEIIMFMKTEAAETVTLYIERDNGYLAKWVGANITPEEAEATAEIFDLLLGDNLAGRKDYIAANGHLYLDELDLA